ncbi:hypothetical protein QBC46DRAFT_393911 [Diplogelasinospora grovesii]|uniref:Oxidoreductase n=1 Tax=Diplogelasinospora grovesii TaxID=303347 RepID=A0AAN6N3X3_9PEZI|nr:hypothetical protein QBC46DRAFT_393911 [Diplogelasinospora grovesii]
MKVSEYDPSKNVPDLSGKVILVTGGTAGIGKELLVHLVTHNPSHLFFTGRNSLAAASVISALHNLSATVPVTFLECDLGRVSTVQSAVSKFLSTFSSPDSSQTPRLDVLVCNAGIMAVPSAVTSDGHEIQFGTNFFGHAALIHLLLPTLLQTAATPGSDVRLLMATSQGYGLHPRGGILFDTLHTQQKERNTWVKYGQAKLAAVLWAREMNRRYPQIRTVSVHPGVINTALVGNLSRVNRAIVYGTNLFSMISPQEGAYNLAWCATANRETLEGGAYYEPVGNKTKLRRDGMNDELAGKLWEWTEKELDKFGIKGQDSQEATV